jgi:hypothetical protein
MLVRLLWPLNGRIAAKGERHDTYNRVFGDGITLRDALVAAVSHDGGCQEKGNKPPSQIQYTHHLLRQTRGEVERGKKE